MKKRERRIKSKLLKKFTGDPIVSFTTPKPKYLFESPFEKNSTSKVLEKKSHFSTAGKGVVFKNARF
jgi:hypothetical protein